MNEWTFGRIWENLIVIRNRQMLDKSGLDGRFEKSEQFYTEENDVKKIILKNAKHPNRQWQVFNIKFKSVLRHHL